VDITVHIPDKVAQQMNSNSNSNKLRQDGDDGAEEAATGLEAVAGPVAEIIQGTLSGNIGQLFKGVTGTVTDQEAQPGVGTILQGVALPLQALWTQGIQAGQKYFNISQPTTAPPKTGALAGAQQLQAGQVQQLNTGAGNLVSPQIIPIEQILPQYAQTVQVQEAVVVPATAPTTEIPSTTEDDEEEEGNEARL